MVPQAIGNVTWAGIGPSEATDPGKHLGRAVDEHDASVEIELRAIKSLAEGGAQGLE